MMEVERLAYPNAEPGELEKKRLELESSLVSLLREKLEKNER